MESSVYLGVSRFFYEKPFSYQVSVQLKTDNR